MIFGKETNISAVICSNGLIQVERNLHGFHRGVLASKGGGGGGLIIQIEKIEKWVMTIKDGKSKKVKFFFIKSLNEKKNIYPW